MSTNTNTSPSLYHLIMLPIGGGAESATVVGIWETQEQAAKDLASFPKSTDYALMIKEAK